MGKRSGNALAITFVSERCISQGLCIYESALRYVKMLLSPTQIICVPVEFHDDYTAFCIKVVLLVWTPHKQMPDVLNHHYSG